MAKQVALRTDEVKSLEDKLITRLMAIVSQRNEIVDCLEISFLLLTIAMSRVINLSSKLLSSSVLKASGLAINTPYLQK